MKKIKNKKKHIKHKQFADRNFSALEDHDKKNRSLNSPFKRIPNMELTSWRDTALHEVLWAALLRANQTQEKSLLLFRKIIINAKENIHECENTFITHSALSILTDSAFDSLMQPLLEDSEAKNILSCLLFLECLPDKRHWERHLSLPTSDTHSEFLMKSIAICSDHQSQESTDIRWFKIMYLTIVSQKIHFPETFDTEELRLYPEYGDQRKVRPSIRALEQTTRIVSMGKTLPDVFPEEMQKKAPNPWQEEFWKECFLKTPCNPLEQKKPEASNEKHYFDEFFKTYHELSEHFLSTITTTGVDSRHDAVFGITFYCLALAITASRGDDRRASGRMVLRSIVEAAITIKYLCLKDDLTIWDQFRNYGSGQTKLAFLKNLKEESLPNFICLEDLERYANEDQWLEFTDIKLKAWANKNLRDIAIEAGSKDLYDKYYDWTSSYTHANWGAIRDTVFTICLNPLHRFHRVPYIFKIDMPSVLPDAAKIINTMLELVSQQYSPFKRRIRHPEKQ